jgi:hypothetical protein
MAGSQVSRKGPSFSPAVVAAWQTAVLRVRSFVVAAELWQRILSEDDRRRLGDNLEAAYASCRGTVGIWMRLRGVSYPRAVIAIGTALNLLDASTGRWLLREFGEVTGEAEWDRQSAIDAGWLVLSEQPREAYWAGQQIESDWDRRSALWDFFWELCRHAKTGQAVDRTAFRELVAPTYVAKQKSRLVNLPGFPTKLAARIKTAGRGSQRLDLPAGEIGLFVALPGGGTREWLP